MRCAWDVTNHSRNEYIESRLSSRATAQHGEPEHAQDNTATETIARTDANAAESKAPKQPVMHGKLMEVDIPTSATPVSSRPGETSPRRAVAQAPGQADGATKKQRLGPDGRPWRSRKRRGSDDIKRDQLVEEFLHENRRTQPIPLVFVLVKL